MNVRRPEICCRATGVLVTASGWCLGAAVDLRQRAIHRSRSRGQSRSGSAAGFSSYTTFITHNAQRAQANDEEGWVITAERLQLCGSANTAHWTRNVLAPGTSLGGQRNTVGGDIRQGRNSRTANVIYVFTLSSGQLGMDKSRTFAAQSSGTGTVRPTAGWPYSQ